VSRAEETEARDQRLMRVGRRRCGYCRSSESIMGIRLVLDHLTPRAHGGTDDEENLWPSCQPCNAFKQARTEARDPESGELAQLINPRRQRWVDHFVWGDGGRWIEGLTAVGRATAAALQLNRKELVEARGLWIAAGWHPPVDDE
jgi:hypothetical protein